MNSEKKKIPVLQMAYSILDQELIPVPCDSRMPPILYLNGTSVGKGLLHRINCITHSVFVSKLVKPIKLYLFYLKTRLQFLGCDVPRHACHANHRSTDLGREVHRSP